ncbi:MAG TPA: ABC transporter ATP-binding protein [Allosphingosinicella sp.]
MSGAILSVNGLSKKFAADLRRSLGYGLRDIAREFVPAHRPAALRPGEFWALEDINFEVAPGDSLAVIGQNGAGKSTLLKILHGLLKPDAGEVRVRGRTQAIIELGTGFNALLTGRENVEVGAALHGLSARDTRRLLDEVVAFAELDAFIDAPVQSYSSGMKARLAYALSAHLEPDLLLVDEALAVGDFEFQRKCVSHMRSYLAKGGALLLVSHNTHQVQAVCKRGLLLEGGRVAFAGSAVDALNQMFERRAAIASQTRKAGNGGAGVEIAQVIAQADDGGPPRSGAEMRLTLHYNCSAPVEATWSFGIWTADHSVCITGGESAERVLLTEGEGSLSCSVPRLPLLPGRYVVRAALLDPDSRFPIALFGWDEAGLSLEVRGEATALLNTQRHLDQLVTLDVNWG